MSRTQKCLQIRAPMKSRSSLPASRGWDQLQDAEVVVLNVMLLPERWHAIQNDTPRWHCAAIAVFCKWALVTFEMLVGILLNFDFGSTLLPIDSSLDAKPNYANSLLPSAPSFTSHTFGIEPMMSSHIYIRNLTLRPQHTRVLYRPQQKRCCRLCWMLWCTSGRHTVNPLNCPFPLPVTFCFHLSTSCWKDTNPTKTGAIFNLLLQCQGQ